MQTLKLGQSVPLLVKICCFLYCFALTPKRHSISSDRNYYVGKKGQELPVAMLSDIWWIGLR